MCAITISLLRKFCFILSFYFYDYAGKERRRIESKDRRVRVSYWIFINIYIYIHTRTINIIIIISVWYFSSVFHFWCLCLFYWNKANNLTLMFPSFVPLSLRSFVPSFLRSSLSRGGLSLIRGREEDIMGCKGKDQHKMLLK